MQSCHLLITLLLLAHVLVGLVAWSIGEFPNKPVTGLLLVSIASSQVGLLAIWLAIGRRAAPWRLVALIATVVVWSWIVASLSGDGPGWVAILLPLAATVVAVLAVARFCGLRLYIIDAEPTKIEDNRPWQFTLGRLFAWTTSLAICLGLLSLTFRHCHELSASRLTALPEFVIGSATVTLICLWLSLTDRRRQLLVALLVILLFVFCNRVFATPNDTMQLLFFILQVPLIIATLLVYRVVGYRLSWKQKNA